MARLGHSLESPSPTIAEKEEIASSNGADGPVEASASEAEVFAHFYGRIGGAEKAQRGGRETERGGQILLVVARKRPCSMKQSELIRLAHFWNPRGPWAIDGPLSLWQKPTNTPRIIQGHTGHAPPEFPSRVPFGSSRAIHSRSSPVGGVFKALRWTWWGCNNKAKRRLTSVLYRTVLHRLTAVGS